MNLCNHCYQQSHQDYERIVNNNVGAIPTNPINITEY